MSRRKRQKKGRAGQDAGKLGSAKEKPFFKPFAGLKAALPKPAPTTPPPAPVAEPPPLSEAELFRDAMLGVAPLDGEEQSYRAPPEPSPDRPARLSEDQEAMIALGEFVSGQGPFDISDTDEHVEGVASGLDPRILKKLRKGEYSVARHLDLHGMVRAEARDALAGFVTTARRDGKRCVLVVHGRGLHSKDQQPVLKEAVVAWLGRSGLRRQILAFATARPYDGGAGALYVLLRKA